MGAVHYQSFIDVTQSGRHGRKCCMLIINWPWIITMAIRKPQSGATSKALQQPASLYCHKSSSRPCAYICVWKHKFIKLPKDWQLVEQATRHPNYSVLPGGATTNHCRQLMKLLLTYMEHEEDYWVEDVIKYGMVGMLNSQFGNLTTNEQSDISWL